MKILLISQFFYPESGASQVRLFEMCKYLSGQGHSVEVYTALPNYPKGKVFKPFKNKIYVKALIEKITIHHLFIIPSSSNSLFLRFLATLSFTVSLVTKALFTIRRNSFDLIIAETPPLNIPYLSLILNKTIFKSVFVLNVSDTWPTALFDLKVLKESSILGKRLLKIEKKLYQESHACIGQSEEIINRIQSLSNQPTLIYRNSVNTTDFTFQPNRYKNKSSGKLKLVYAGLLGLAQKLSVYIENIPFDELGYELHIYGDGPDRGNVENNCVKTKGIFYHGFKDYAQITQILGDYDFSFIPMIEYVKGTVPAKTYESMAAGLPIIMAASGEAADLVHSNNIGWVSAPGNFKQLINNLKSISHTDSNTLSKISNDCRELAANKYDRSFQNKRLGQFIDTIVNGN